MTESGAYISDRETWSLPELVTWIMTRDWVEVSTAAPKETASSKGCDGSEFVRLKYRRRYRENGRNPDRIRVEIKVCGLKGKLTAWGNYKQSDELIEILPEEWFRNQLVFDDASENEGLKRSGDAFRSDRPRWTGLRFAIEDALANWPGPPKPEEVLPTELETAIAAGRTTVGAIKRCQKWLEGLMLAGPKTKTKTCYFKEAQKKFPVARRGFDQAWANAIEEVSV